jgi:hypothetical protein
VKSFTNQGLYRRLKVTEDNPFIEIKNTKIYLVHDTPHLIKLVRNNLMRKDFKYYHNQTSKIQTAKWRDIVQFYENDTKRLPRMAPKLTKLHIFVRDFSKVKVKLATQILSHSVAAGFRALVSFKIMSEEGNETADFVEKIDTLFDLLNISTDCDRNKVDKSGRFLIENLGVLDKCFEFIKSIEVPTKKRPDCLRGLALTLRGIGHLIKDLRQEGYQYVLKRNLQQDDLENFFSVLRMKGGRSKNPTSREFRHNFKFVFIKSFLKRSRSSNCRDKDSENINFDLTLLSSLFESKISSEHEADSVVSFFSESELQELCGVDVQGKALSCLNVPFFL